MISYRHLFREVCGCHTTTYDMYPGWVEHSICRGHYNPDKHHGPALSWEWKGPAPHPVNTQGNPGRGPYDTYPEEVVENAR